MVLLASLHFEYWFSEWTVIARGERSLRESLAIKKTKTNINWFSNETKMAIPLERKRW